MSSTRERLADEVDTWKRNHVAAVERAKNAEVRLEKALAALREIEDPGNDSAELRGIARAAIAGIEGS